MALHKNNKMEGWEKTFSACQIWFILNWTKWFTRWQFHQYQQVWLLRQNILTYTNYTLSLSLSIYIYTKYVRMHKSITHIGNIYIYTYASCMHRICICMTAWHYMCLRHGIRSQSDESDEGSRFETERAAQMEETLSKCVLSQTLRLKLLVPEPCIPRFHSC